MSANVRVATAVIAVFAACPCAVRAGDASDDTTVARGSTTARTLASRASDSLNAADYGVVCDGLTDNAGNFAAALAAAGARHVNLLVPAGVCASSKTILNDYSGVTMIGASGANSVGNLGGEAFVGTTIKYTGAAGGTMLVIGPVAISPTSWTVDFDGRDSLQSQGLLGITLDCGGLATRGIYAANTADLLIDARVYQPVNHASGTTPYYATAMEVDANVNRGSISLSWYENAAAAGEAGIRPINSYPADFADGSDSYNYVNPAAPYPIGIWFHSAFTHAARLGGGITGGNPSYTSMPRLISSNQNHGVPIQVDWADHLSFGLIDQYGAGSSLVGAAGMVINNSNLMWASGRTVGDTPAGSHTMVLTDVDLVNPNGQVMLANGAAGLPSNDCFITRVDYSRRTLSICGPGGTSADIPSGTPVSYLRDAAGLSPGGITVDEYQSGAPLLVAGMTGTAFAAPQGITINKYDIANGTPAPVIGRGTAVDWEDDLSVHHRFTVGTASGAVSAGDPTVAVSSLATSVGPVLDLNGAGLALGSPSVTVSTDANGLKLNGSGLSVGYPIRMFNSGVYELQLYGDTAGNLNLGAAGLDQVGHAGCSILSGTASPVGLVSAPQCSLYLRSGGGAGSTLYVKESGSGTAGWAAK